MTTDTVIKKTGLTVLLSLTLISTAYASDAVSNPQASNNSIEFARQAGSIAGVAQACGQNINDFNQRIAEAIDKLTLNPTDKAATALVYQQVTREAMASEQKTHTIPCTKVLADYRNLPIMQADYKEKVIAQLNPTS